MRILDFDFAKYKNEFDYSMVTDMSKIVLLDKPHIYTEDELFDSDYAFIADVITFDLDNCQVAVVGYSYKDNPHGQKQINRFFYPNKVKFDRIFGRDVYMRHGVNPYACGPFMAVFDIKEEEYDQIQAL